MNSWLMTFYRWKAIRRTGVIWLVLLTGCPAVGPDYRSPQPEMPAAWQGSIALSTFGAGYASGRWWTLFRDPLLDSLVMRASAANLDLQRAAARIREARAERVIAGATGSIFGSAEASHSRRSENVSSTGSNRNLFQIGFDAAWEIDIFGGVRRSVESADAALAATEEDLRAVLVTLQAEVARNYLELRGSEKRLATTRKNIATQERTVEVVRGRYEMGLGNELDLVQAETQLALTRATVPALEAAARQSMYQLALLLGGHPGSLTAELSREAAIPLAPDGIPVDLPSELMRQRPDIRAAERRLAAATADIGVATAELFPRFSLPAAIGLQSTSLGDLISKSSRFWAAGPVIDLALFDQGRRRAGVEISEARRDAAIAEYQQSVLAAFAEVEIGLAAFVKEQETRRILMEAVDSSERAVAMATGLFESGLTDFLNVLQSERALYQSEDQLAQSEQRLNLALVAIFKALGGGWRDGLEQGVAAGGNVQETETDTSAVD